MTVLQQHSSHWGAFTAEVEAGRVVGVRGFARDPAPPALLANIPDLVHAPCRIDRPYVRKGWLQGRRAGHPRGGEAFVPVGWDQALRLVAEESARVRAEHGPASIFGGSYGWSSAGRFHHARTQLHRYLGVTGGYTGQVTNYSYGAGMTLMPHIVGNNACIQGPTTDWAAIVDHAKLCVAFGGLPAKNGLVAAGGAGVHEYGGWHRRAARAGVRMVNVSPVRGDVPADVGAEWVPIRPGADTAFMLGMAHTILAEGLHDQDFLDRCTDGFAALAAYVLGESDGQPKTAEWAAALADVPAETIRQLGRDIVRLPSMLTATWSLQRADFGEQPYWMLVALASMAGQVGRPGCGFAFGFGSMNGMGTPRIELATPSLSGGRNPADSWIPVARITDMLEKPGEEYDYNGQRRLYPDTRMIFWAGGNPLHHHQDLNRLLRAWARPDTIVVSDPLWTAAARHADIVLPATTTLERNDIGASSRDRFIIAMRQVVRPQAQARNDFDILADLADAAGVRERFTEQRNESAWLRFLYERARHQVQQEGQAMPDFDSFWEQGFIEFPAPDQPYTEFAGFRADPGGRRLRTQSGRIQIGSPLLGGFGHADCPGHPAWREPREWQLSPLAEKFPLHLLSCQPSTRLHSQGDPGRVSLASKIEGREPIRMHPEDAAARGLVAGQVVRIFNDRGACLGGLVLDDGLRQGVVVMATGAWFDPLEPGVAGSLCVHGNPNVLTRDEGTSALGQGPVAQSCLVEIEAFEGKLPPVRVHLPPPIEALA
ncbi:MAG: molybdopterin-dependent oxidoreductase [Acetobacteraceae bacterium]|nr:molybdopterin-dependent oxidoreductase [Acetobacteraceae bacterium]